MARETGIVAVQVVNKPIQRSQHTWITSHKAVLSAELHAAPQQELSSCHRTSQLGDDVAGLTYVGTHIHNNILVLDLDPVLQVALLFHNLFVDEKSFNLGLSRHRPTIG